MIADRGVAARTSGPPRSFCDKTAWTSCRPRRYHRASSYCCALASVAFAIPASGPLWYDTTHQRQVHQYSATTRTGTHLRCSFGGYSHSSPALLHSKQDGRPWSHWRSMSRSRAQVTQTTRPSLTRLLRAMHLRHARRLDMAGQAARWFGWVGVRRNKERKNIRRRRKVKPP